MGGHGSCLFDYVPGKVPGKETCTGNTCDKWTKRGGG